MRKYMPVELDKLLGRSLVRWDERIEKNCQEMESPFQVMLDPDTFEIMIRGARADGVEVAGANRFEVMKHLVKSTIGPVQTYQSWWWRKQQRPIIDISEDLCRAMMETEITIPPTEIRSPYRAFYIAIPPSMKMTMRNKLLGINHRLDGIMVAIANEELMINTYGWPPDDFDPTKIGFNRIIAPLDFNVSVEDYLSNEEVRGKLEESVGEGNADKAIPWMRIVINSMLYLESEGADVDRSPDLPDRKARRLASIKAKKQRTDFIEKNRHPWSLVRIGHNLTIHEGIKKASGELRSRFIVRGHWRNQAHGPNLSLRKRKWIQPHWKGPDWADVMEGRIYKMETP
jgi:hypothetical protein